MEWLLIILGLVILLLAGDALVRGAVNLSFPILDPSGHALAALTCPFLERIDDYKAPGIDEVTAMYTATAAEIARQISGGDPGEGRPRSRAAAWAARRSG